jgi:putative FmdB family regulatory protein
MPLYEYECEACAHRFETIRKFSDAPLEKCPKCGGRVHKLQSAPAFQFKGSGWYITDYAKKDSSSSASKPDANSTESATKTESKTETAASAPATTSSEKKD